MKITAKFRASRRLSFEDTKKIMSPEMRPKSFGTFEKQAPGLKPFPILPKARISRTHKVRLVLVLLLIGRETGAIFINMAGTRNTQSADHCQD